MPCSAYDRWLVKPLEHQKPHRAGGRHGDDERQEALVGLPTSALMTKKPADSSRRLSIPTTARSPSSADLRRQA